MAKRKMRFIAAGLVLAICLVASVMLLRRSHWAGQTTMPLERIRGKSNAPVVMVEFTDFQCPSCKKASLLIHELLERYPDDLAVVFKHFPLETIHPLVRQAHEAAQCAQAQKKFWPYHDLLFEKQEEWPKSKDVKAEFLRYAGDLGLNQEVFAACLNDPKTGLAISADAAEGKLRQVDSTPTFLLGEFRLVGSSQLHRDGARLIELLINERRRKRKN